VLKPEGTIILTLCDGKNGDMEWYKKYVKTTSNFYYGTNRI